MLSVLLLWLTLSPDAGTAPGLQPREAPRLLEATLRAAFAHCKGMTVETDPTVRLNLPSRCRFSDGRSAQGTLKFEFLRPGAADAPVRERDQRFRVTAAPFTLEGIEFEGVLLEARMGDDAREMTLLARDQKIKTRPIGPEPGQRWVETQPPRDHAFDPIGDDARDVVRFAAVAPSVAVGLGRELARLLQAGALQSAPELVALWALSAPVVARNDGGF